MKIIFLDKVIFEGTQEECDAFRQSWLDMIAKLDDELENTFSMRGTDTWETYFEALKTLNPFVYETLSYFKELVGEYFVSFSFYKMRVASVGIRMYDHENPKRTRIITFGHIYMTVLFELPRQNFWRIEE